jgi:hypothetical protein
VNWCHKLPKRRAELLRARIRRQGGIEQGIGEIKQFAMFAIDGRIAGFAARMLADNGMSPRCLANLLQRLGDSGNEAAGAGGRQSANVYIARHPATAERTDALGGPACE